MQLASATPIRVMHLEDYKIMRDGVEALLSLDTEISVVGQAENQEELLEKLAITPVDVLILDLFLDGMEDLKTVNGFQVCKIVREQYPAISIVAHSAYDDASRVTEILNAGAKGFVSKKSGFNELIRAIKTVHNGNLFLCIKTAKKLKNTQEYMAGLEQSLKGADEIFSPRERQILILLSQGHSSREIGSMLSITERTIETHRKNMIKKANVKNVAELIAHSASLGIIKK